MSGASALGAQRKTALLEAAQQARKQAYAPYSGFAVGAALLGKSGRIYSGCNVENAAYPAGICAERVALGTAVAAGERDFLAIAVAVADGAQGAPCGICRQVLHEFAADLLVLYADGSGNTVERKLCDLLPDGFLLDR